MVKRIPYEREADNIDVKSELENLRQHYANLQYQKELEKGKAWQKAMTAKPSEAQLRLYKEGVHKITTMKLDEEQKKSYDPYSVRASSRNASPVCDRLYEQGMIKKLHQAKEEQRSDPSPSSRRNRIASSPACDRLYTEGVAKLRARKSSIPRRGRSSSSSRKNISANQRRSISSDRYIDDDTRRGISIRSSSPNPTCDRLYEKGKAKLRSLAKANKLPPASRRGRSPVVRSISKDQTIYDADTAPSEMKLRDVSPAPTQPLSKEDDDFVYDEILSPPLD